MKFKVKAEPKDGDTRTRVFFTFLPTEIMGHWYWLCTVCVSEQFHIPRCEGYFEQWIPFEVRP